MADGLLRICDVLKLVPVGRSTWWAGVKSGRFPQPVKLGPRTTVWHAEDIRAMIEATRQPVTLKPTRPAASAASEG